MRRLLRAIGIIAVVFLVVAQFVKITRTNPPVESDVPAPADVKVALRGACYDCHSNETTWPWYSHVAPVSWLLAYDVSEGREELNFSTWQRYDAAKQQKKLKETIETLHEGEMPPWYYSILHPAARLADKDRQAIVTWASQGGANASGFRANPEFVRRSQAD
jgi:Haem-binding domain